MPRLQIGSQQVDVGSEFTSMSPEDQQRTVDEIGKSLGGAAGDQTAIGAFARSIPQGVITQAGTKVAGLPAALEAMGQSTMQGQLRQQQIEEMQTPEQEQQLQQARGAVRESAAQAGEAISSFGEKQFPISPKQQGLLTEFGQGLGSVAENIATGVVPGLPLVTALAGGAGEGLLEARRKGATQEQQDRVAFYGTLPGATDLMDNLIPTFGVGKLAGFIGKFGARVLKAAFAEGGQEGVQQLMQNAIAKGVYDPNRDITEDVPRSALVGALVGGAVGGVVGGRHGEAQAEKPPVIGTPEGEAALNQQFAVLGPEAAPAPTPAPALTPTMETQTPTERALAGSLAVKTAANPAEFQERVRAALAGVRGVPPTPFTSVGQAIQEEEATGKPLEGERMKEAVALAPPVENFGTIQEIRQTAEGKTEALGPREVKTDPGVEATNVERLKVAGGDPNQIVMHDNTAVSPTGGPLTGEMPRVSMTELGVGKFGQRFYDYSHGVGRLFQELRDVVAGLPLAKVAGEIRGYSHLRGEQVGTSFDQMYHGASIRVPIKASLINPGLPVSTRPENAAAGMITTMIHEFAHSHIRDEGGAHQVEMERIANALAQSPGFNMPGFKQRLVDHLTRHRDVMSFMNGIYRNGYVEPRGQSFELRAEQRRDVNQPTNIAAASAGLGASRGSELGDWVALSNSSIGASADAGGGKARTSAAGGADFGLRANQRALDAEAGPGTPATVQPQEYRPAYQAVQASGVKGPTAINVSAAGAHAARYNSIYKFGAGILEVLHANPWHEPLRRAAQLARQMYNEENKAQDAAVTIGKTWRRLGAQGEGLRSYILSMTNQEYRTPAEVAAGISRNPTSAEQARFQTQHKLLPSTVQFYDRVQNYFRVSMRLMAQDAKAHIRLLAQDPRSRLGANEILKFDNAVDAELAQVESAPYFPFAKFGTYFVNVTDKNGQQVDHALFEPGLIPRPGGERGQARIRQTLKRKEFERKYPGMKVEVGKIPESAKPFVGMPAMLMDQIGRTLALRPDQQRMLQMMKFRGSPIRTMKHTMERGHSVDFSRSFSNYAFFMTRYRTRVKYVPMLEKAVEDARAMAMSGLGNKLADIHNHMRDWLDNTIIDAKSDYGLLKGSIFHWSMAYVPAAATQNLMQTPLVTHPYLGGRFGTVASARAMMKAITDIGNFHRKGYYAGQTADTMKSIAYAIEKGYVSETQAAELAALANSSNMLEALGDNGATRTATWILQNGALMFEMAEQFNRRVAWRAAYDLAMRDNSNKAVDHAVMLHQPEYDDLISKGWSPQVARATMVAANAVEQTQFVYGHYARPRFMRGKTLGTITVFKRYTQSLLFLMFSGDKRYLLRYMMAAGLAGGAGGLPFFEDMKQLIELGMKLSGWGGEAWSAEEEMRRYIELWFGDKVPPDLVLHGFARRGFGLPSVMDWLGSYATGRPGRGLMYPTPGTNVPFPVLDRSKSITPQILPLDVSKLATMDVDKAFGQESQQALGAAVSAAMNVIKTLVGVARDPGSASDLRTWEKAEPRAIARMSKAYRAFTEMEERGGRGGPASATPILKYDPRDTEQMAEIIAIGLGYNTLRETQKYDQMTISNDHIAQLNFNRQIMMNQINEAIQGGIPAERMKVREMMTRFNQSLRPEEKGYAITPEAVQRSVESRIREKKMQEMGLDVQKRQIPIRKGIMQLFPESVIDAQRR